MLILKHMGIRGTSSYPVNQIRFQTETLPAFEIDPDRAWAIRQSNAGLLQHSIANNFGKHRHGGNG